MSLVVSDNQKKSVRCKKCGSELDENPIFCGYCGEKVTWVMNPTVIIDQKNMSKSKTLFPKIVYIVSFLLAFVVVRYSVQELFSPKSTNTDIQNKLVDHFDNTELWVDFSSTLGHFEVIFPAYPSHDRTPLNIPGLDQPVNLETYSSGQSDGTTYAVNWTVYPSIVDTSVPRNNLEGSVNGTVWSTNGDLVSSKFSSFSNYDAVDYLIYKTDGDVYIRGKNFLVDHTIYQIVVSYESKNSAGVQFDKFVNSFRLN